MNATLIMGFTINNDDMKYFHDVKINELLKKIKKCISKKNGVNHLRGKIYKSKKGTIKRIDYYTFILNFNDISIKYNSFFNSIEDNSLNYQ